jgi:hypothetical protein
MRRDRVRTTGTMQMRLQGSRPATRDRPRWSGHAALAVVVSGVALSACSLHVSRHGISGNILGHSFSGAEGVLPAGFPNNVPVPDHSRVLAGGGTNNAWDVAFAVTGPVTSGTSGYESKLGAAGYTITNIRSGSTPVTAVTDPGSGSTSTTITVAGTEFTAADSSWTIQVASGTTTSPTGGGLKAGEFAINITVIAHPSGTTPSTFGLRAGVHQEPGVGADDPAVDAVTAPGAG